MAGVEGDTVTEGTGCKVDLDIDTTLGRLSTAALEDDKVINGLCSITREGLFAYFVGRAPYRTLTCSAEWLTEARMLLV